uniref:Uncharacterized protein n=1 Tax=Arundo donax TaxID=35708 RepID=A0A0A8YT21_ARUDO
MVKNMSLSGIPRKVKMVVIIQVLNLTVYQIKNTFMSVHVFLNNQVRPIYQFRKYIS